MNALEQSNIDLPNSQKILKNYYGQNYFLVPTIALQLQDLNY